MGRERPRSALRQPSTARQYRQHPARSPPASRGTGLHKDERGRELKWGVSIRGPDCRWPQAGGCEGQWTAYQNEAWAGGGEPGRDRTASKRT
eukprot:4016039-Prymnesium_polylepis.1